MREFLRDAEVGRWEGFRRQRADVHAMKIGLSGTHGRAFAGLMSNIGIKLDAQWKGRSQPPLCRQNEPLEHFGAKRRCQLAFRRPVPVSSTSDANYMIAGSLHVGGGRVSDSLGGAGSACARAARARMPTSRMPRNSTV